MHLHLRWSVEQPPLYELPQMEFQRILPTGVSSIPSLEG